MFDIGFPELLVVALIALVVLGPNRLPEAMRTLGLMFGRLRRTYLSARAEIEHEIGMDEVRRELHNESIMREFKSIESSVKKLDAEVKQEVSIDPPEGGETSKKGDAKRAAANSESETDDATAAKQRAEHGMQRES